MIKVCDMDRIADTVPLAIMFFNLAPENGTFNEESYKNFWHKQYDNASGAIIIEEQNGEIKGILGLVLTTEFTTGNAIATEIGWFSQGSGGVRMFKYAKELARKAGAKVFYSQHMLNDEKTARFFEREGAKANYIKYSQVL